MFLPDYMGRRETIEENDMGEVRINIGEIGGNIRRIRRNIGEIRINVRRIRINRGEIRVRKLG